MNSRTKIHAIYRSNQLYYAIVPLYKLNTYIVILQVYIDKYIFLMTQKKRRKMSEISVQKYL